MPKVKYKKLNFIPISVNLSDIELENNLEFELGDDQQEVEKTYNKLFAEEVVVQVLHNLKEREKIIFMFQLLRESGFEIDHESCSDLLGLQRQSYMQILSVVKKKASVILKNAYKPRQ